MLPTPIICNLLPLPCLPIPPHRRKFVGCVKDFEREGRDADAALISVLRPPVALQDSCDYR